MIRDTGDERGRGVYASEPLAAGTVAVSSRRVAVLPERTTHTIQWTDGTHLDVDEPGRVVNHSCDPNVALRPNEHGAYDFVTLRAVEADEELCFDYESTEAVITAFSEPNSGAAS